MKLTKAELDKIKLATATEAALGLFEQSKGGKIILDTPNGYHIEVEGKKRQEPIKGSQGPPAVLDKLAFSESYRYLKNAEDRFNTKTAEGYSDCKANCRNALVSALKTLTGKEEIREAVKELGKQGILGKREQEFIESFAELLVKLHGLVSKKGPHPPMTREEDDAEFALSITTSTLGYITNQATRQRG